MTEQPQAAEGRIRLEEGEEDDPLLRVISLADPVAVLFRRHGEVLRYGTSPGYVLQVLAKRLLALEDGLATLAAPRVGTVEVAAQEPPAGISKPREGRRMMELPVSLAAWRQYLLAWRCARIVFDGGESVYHLTPVWGGRLRRTRCGLEAKVWDGCIEVDVLQGEWAAEDALQHVWLEKLQPCPTCWAFEQEGRDALALLERSGVEGG